MEVTAVKLEISKVIAITDKLRQNSMKKLFSNKSITDKQTAEKFEI